MELPAGTHAIHARIAGEAKPDLTALGSLVDPVRIGEQRPAKSNEIDPPLLDDRNGRRGISETTDSDDRNAHPTLHGFRETEERRRRRGHRRYHDGRGRLRAIVPTGHVYGIRT